MNINAQIRYYTETISWLCFRHAITEAMKGESVETEIGDFTSDYYLGSTICAVCLSEDESRMTKEKDERRERTERMRSDRA